LDDLRFRHGQRTAEFLDERSLFSPSRLFLFFFPIRFLSIDIEHSVHVIPALIFFSHRYPVLFSFLMYT